RADRPRDMGAVTVAVLARHAQGVIHVVRAAAELRVQGPNPGVDDVGVHARTGGGVAVRARQRQGALVDAIEAPRIAVRIHRLSDVRPYHFIGLDEGDERVLL